MLRFYVIVLQTPPWYVVNTWSKHSKHILSVLEILINVKWQYRNSCRSIDRQMTSMWIITISTLYIDIQHFSRPFMVFVWCCVTICAQNPKHQLHYSERKHFLEQDVTKMPRGVKKKNCKGDELYNGQSLAQSLIWSAGRFILRQEASWRHV